MQNYKRLDEEDYKEICSQLQIDPATDSLATRLLDDKLDLSKTKKTQKELARILAGKIVLIFGAGPSLEETIQTFFEKNLDPSSKRYDDKIVIIAVDGATKALLENGLGVDVIVSDLDGSLEAISDSHKRRGALVIIHAHGDNMPRIEKMFEILTKERVVGTTQIEETEKVRNLGGFTDGDRAAYIAANMHAKKVILFAFDFGEIIGRFSKPEEHGENFKVTKRKAIKFKIAKELLSKLPEKFPETEFYNCTPKGEEISNIPKISFVELEKILFPNSAN